LIATAMGEGTPTMVGRMWRSLPGLLAIAIAPSASIAGAAPSLQPEAEMLAKVVSGVHESYIRPVAKEELASSLVKELNRADAREAAMVACESEPNVQVKPRFEEWVYSLDHAVTCSTRLRGGSESQMAIDAAVATTLMRLDRDGRFLRVVSQPGGGKEYGIPIATRMNPGMIGVTVKNPDPQGSEVVSLMPDGPAAKAGIQVGDVIIRIGSKPTSSLSPDEVIHEFLAPPGSTVELAIRRRSGDNAQINVVTIERSQNPIQVLSNPQSVTALVPTMVTSEMREGLQVITMKRLVYGETAASLKSMFKATKKAPQPQAILLDFSTCTGGELDSALEVADLLLDGGPIWRTQGRSIGDEVINAHRGTSSPVGVPIFILISGATGGACELIAAALTDTGTAKSIGQRTSGAGTIKVLFPVSNDRAVSIAQGRLIRPIGKNISDGIEPDIVLEEHFESSQNMLTAALSRLSAAQRN